MGTWSLSSSVVVAPILVAMARSRSGRLEPINKTRQKPEVDPGDPPDLVEPLLSEAEASQFLGISKMTLLRKRNAGLVGFFRVGIRVLYSKEKHLLPYLAHCEVQRQVR